MSLECSTEPGEGLNQLTALWSTAHSNVQVYCAARRARTHYSRAAESGLLRLACHCGSDLLKFKFWSFSDSSKLKKKKKICVHKNVTKITKQNSLYSENKNLRHFLLSSFVKGKVKKREKKKRKKIWPIGYLKKKRQDPARPLSRTLWPKGHFQCFFPAGWKSYRILQPIF